MLSKEELLEKDVSELETIAQESGAVYSKGDDKDKLVYAILDRQAEEISSAHPMESKRKRTRIARKDTDRVYSVHGDEGENFDVQKNKPTGDVQTSLFKDDETPVALNIAEESQRQSLRLLQLLKLHLKLSKNKRLRHRSLMIRR